VNLTRPLMACQVDRPKWTTLTTAHPACRHKDSLPTRLRHTGVPRSQDNAPPLGPCGGLGLLSYGSPRGGGFYYERATHMGRYARSPLRRIVSFRVVRVAIYFSSDRAAGRSCFIDSKLVSVAKTTPIEMMVNACRVTPANTTELVFGTSEAELS